MTVGTGTTLVGLINAAIGGNMLVIPILSLKAGYLDWGIACILLCVITAYTAYLMTRHLGKAKNVKYLILYHFKHDRFYTTVYNIVIWLSFMGAVIIYFKLFCIQIEGLFQTTTFVPEGIAIFLIIWAVVLRECDLSEIALASGITSIIGYVIYLIWVLDTAPQGPKFIPPSTKNSTPLILSLLNAYTIHDFLIQVITFNPNRKDYPKIVVILYFVTNWVFMLACYSASGLVNRVPGRDNPETIIDFFQGSQNQGWNLTLLQILYVVHILTTVPEYLIVSKIRIFQILEIEHDSSKGITISEVLYISVMVGICYVLKKINVPFELVIDFTGALLGYVFSFFIPIFIHLKCLHYDHSSGYIKDEHDRNLCILSNECECDLVYRSKYTLWFQTFFLIFLNILGGIYFLGELKSDLVKELGLN